MVAGEPLGGSNRDEELRTVRVGAGVCHGKLAGGFELEWRALGFILELVARSAHAGATGIAPLNHEVGNDAVKDRSVVKRTRAFFAADAVLPFALTFGKLHKICHRLGCFLFEQAADDGALIGEKGCV